MDDNDEKTNNETNNTHTNNNNEGFSFLGYVTGAILFSVVILVVSCLSVAWLLVGWWNRALYTRYQTKIEQMWVYLVEVVLGSTELVVTGDPVDNQETAIIISNHQMDVDWWYIWYFAKKYEKHGNLKIALKYELFYVPVFGLGVLLLDFLLLTRKWEKDEAVLKQKVKAWGADGDSFWYLIFPEGTTNNTLDLEKSHQFSKEHDRPHLDLLLLPRVKGLKSSLECLGSRVDAIYDLTLGYEGYSGEVPTPEQGYSRNIDKKIPNFQNLASGVKPERVHFHVTRYSAKEALESEDFTKWADNVFVHKEKLLRHFIQHQKFPLKAKSD